MCYINVTEGNKVVQVLSIHDVGRQCVNTGGCGGRSLQLVHGQLSARLLTNYSIILNSSWYICKFTGRIDDMCKQLWICMI